MQNSASTDSEKRSWFKDVWNSVGNTDGIFTLYIEADDLQRVKNRLVQVKKQIEIALEWKNSGIFVRSKFEPLVPASLAHRNFVLGSVLAPVSESQAV